MSAIGVVGRALDELSPIGRAGSALDELSPIGRAGSALDELSPIGRTGSALDELSPIAWQAPLLMACRRFAWLAAFLLPAVVGMAAEPLRFDFDGSSPPHFAVKVPEGSYRVTIRFGSAVSASRTTVLGEARRLLLQDVVTARGDFTTRDVIVNVRTPSLAPPPPNAPGGSSVRLNSREIGSANWDDALTLDFVGATARVAGISIEPVAVPTVYLAGDSTVTDQAIGPGASWGQMLPRFFAPSVAIANHAESGETLKSFLTELRLDKILATLETGDWLLIQFGHNDQKAQWPQTYVEAATTYRAYLRAYIAEARRLGATPILITSPERRNFDGSGHIVESHRDYPDAVRAVAREESVALIDLHAMSKTFYEVLGPTRAPLAFADGGRDLTHHSEYGAYELARMVARGLRDADAKLTANLAAHLAPDAKPFDPARARRIAAGGNGSIELTLPPRSVVVLKGGS